MRKVDWLYTIKFKLETMLKSSSMAEVRKAVEELIG